MRCGTLGLVLTVCLSGCATTSNSAVYQNRLDEISAPLMTAWGEHCETGLGGLESTAPQCLYEVLVREDKSPNAYADGDRVYVTSGMLAGFDDLALSLVIAHEMAHNVLGHVDMDIAESRELEADRWALYLLKVADIDYEKAVENPNSAHDPSQEGGAQEDDEVSQKERRRADHFSTVIAEIKPTQ